MSVTGKQVRKLESAIATIHLSGVASQGSSSSTDSCSDSEADLPEHVRGRAAGQGQHAQVPHKDSSPSVEPPGVSNTEASSESVIDQVMVNSSDSGCPTSPKDYCRASPKAQDQGTFCDEYRATGANTAKSDKSSSEGVHDTTESGCSHDIESKPVSQLREDSDLQSSHHKKSENSLVCERTDGSPVTSPVSPTRFNPFDADADEEQDPFPQLTKDSGHKLRGSASSSLWSEEDVRTGTGPTDSNPELGITEDYFSEPEGHFGALSIAEMEEMVRDCREMVLQASPDSESKKTLVHKLVHLRLKLAEAKEEQVAPDENVKPVMGHMFVLKDTARTRRYCEQCNSVIWGVIQGWFRCDHCGFCCHEKCLDLVTRTCAIVKVKECTEYILTICPEKSLSSQNYKCGECRRPLSFHSNQGEARLCDYTGNFYCDRCHWNDVMVVPARVLHNWDFEPKKVCRGTKQFLKLMHNKAVLRVQDVNPMLFNFVEELNEVKKLREEILIMKKYFMLCKDALKSKLLLQLQDRQHFVETSDMYSLQDLCDVTTDVLLPELAKIHASFAQHIKTDCELCQAQGYVCELCEDHEVLFPFDNIAIVCSLCSTVLHRHCYMRRNQKCPKCLRINSRTD